MKNIKLNFSIFQRFWAIGKLYWWESPEKWRAIGLFILLLCLLSLDSTIGLNQLKQQGELISALVDGDSERFWKSAFFYIGASIVLAVTVATWQYLEDKIRLHSREWLTKFYLDKYFQNDCFYKINTLYREIDNPDQRIAEDIASFCHRSVTLFRQFALAIFNLFAFGILLWEKSKLLVLILVIYSVGGMLITTIGFGKILIPIKKEQLKREANFRFGLVRIRENAESIAFYNGGDREFSYIKQVFAPVLSIYNKVITWERNLDIFQNIYNYITWMLPALIIGPRILAGEPGLEVGAIQEANGAFGRVFRSLNIIVRMFEFLTSFIAGIERLESFVKVLEEPKASPVEGSTTIDTVEDSRLSLQHLTLQTPNYQRTLVKNVSIELKPGEGLLIVGVSGSGKSSILRAIAGLWNSGTGTIYRPKLEEILFLPQHPYMILGSLRDQLLYPRTDLNISDEIIYRVLNQVNLPKLAEIFGGLDTVEDWENMLSMGEQQRVAFARLLLTQPRYAILDEATSALDVQNEQSLYQHLQSLSTTYVSVGHRPTLLQYHHQVLEVMGDETWRVTSAQDYKFMPIH
ncbi:MULTISPECIES: ABC transporter ATP-binding protein/permease [Okeania]|uniref:ABC transporter ATP-binding protein/permease n=1 Tax=Okeania hirsuta TaxID=1458930 RepID=A0A3N6PBK0_9CYAN|nr:MULTISPECIES: ABC transporter ATP-binding protein/permease [Okeania]NES87856.1 ABC transporter ATP-binding protein/permease [Okeania sp. SIO2B9]RQH11923.1 ABC transporter ATP-binding protein/permease [Okeania hirsuta]RQH47514.1 ABC transporter ATP-binding protein/permease [Okeania hirsuta]